MEDLLKIKKTAILTLFAFIGAGFPFLDNFELILKDSYRLEAAQKSSKKTSKRFKKAEKKTEDKTDKNASENSDFLADNERAKDYMPDIYRCPDCGYEQDESGFCPDHPALKLIKIISTPKDPLAPAELDGNEDILVDVPLNLEFRKDELEVKVEESGEAADKSSKKPKKSK